MCRTHSLVFHIFLYAYPRVTYWKSTKSPYPLVSSWHMPWCSSETKNGSDSCALQESGYETNAPNAHNVMPPSYTLVCCKFYQILPFHCNYSLLQRYNYFAITINPSSAGTDVISPVTHQCQGPWPSRLGPSSDHGEKRESEHVRMLKWYSEW